MTLPSLPTLGSTSWYPYASALDAKIRNGATFNVQDYGAVGTGTGDQKPAIQAAIDAAAAAGGGTVYIPAGVYRTLTGIVHKPKVHVVGAGTAATRILNQSSPPGFYESIVWHYGTYGPGNGPTAVQLEAGFTVTTTPAGSSKVTFVTAGNASNFAVGDTISWEGGTIGVAAAPRIPNGIAKVMRISGADMYLDRPVPYRLATADAAPTVRKLNTGALTLTGLGAAFILTDASLRDLTLEGTVAGYPILSLACMDSVVDNVYTVGDQSLVGNAIVGSQFNRVHGQYQHAAIEFAYMSHDNTLTDCRWSRYGTDPVPSGSLGIWINSGEGGRDTHFRNCELVDVTPDASTSAHATVELADGCTWIGGRIVGSRTSGMNIYADNVAVRDVTVYTTVGDGIQFGGSHVELRNNRVLAAGSGAAAIRASTFAVDSEVIGNRLGEPGSRTSVHVVRDEGTRTRKRDNLTFHADEAKAPLFQTWETTTSGIQAEYDLMAMTFTAGTVSQPGQLFRLHGRGYAQGSGTRTIRVKLGTTTVASFTPGVGEWSIAGTITTAADSSTWVHDFRTTSAGTTSGALAGITSLTWTTVAKIALTAQSTAADDFISSRLRDLSFSSDGAFYS